MKKTIILSMVLAATSFLSAQTSKGSMMLGGSLSFNSGKDESTDINGGTSMVTDETKIRDLNFTPSFGYFVADKLAVGLVFSLASNSMTTTVPNATGFSKKEEKQVLSGAAFGLFLRKYLMTNEKFGFYGQASFVRGSYKVEETYTLANGNSTKDLAKGPATIADLSAGIVYFPSKRIGLHAGFGGLGWSKISITSSESTSPNASSNFESSGFNFNLNSASINFGFSYFFGR